MKRYLNSPKFFIDRVQIFFALVLVCVVFAIVYFIYTQSGTPQAPSVPPSHSKQPVTTLAPKQVMPSEQNGTIAIQPTLAITLVDSVKAVQQAKAAVTTSNNKFVTEIDSYPSSQHYYYVIHAYEIVSDGNGNAHTATVGWYRVNPQTGKVTNADNL